MKEGGDMETRAITANAVRRYTERPVVDRPRRPKETPAKEETTGKSRVHEEDWVEIESRKTGEAVKARTAPPEAVEHEKREAAENHETPRPEPEMIGAGWSRENTDYDYDVSETSDLVVKVVDKEDRSRVIRQYPSEERLSLKKAFMRFLELIRG